MGTRTGVDLDAGELRQGDATQPPLQVSKWLRINMLLAPCELRALFDSLAQASGTLSLHRVGSVVPRDQLTVPIDQFVEYYSEYVDLLKRSEPVDHQHWNRQFSVAMTADPDALFYVPVGDDRAIIRACRPVIQLQHHTFQRSPDDGQFRSTVLGSDTVSWGIQLGYPQVVFDKASMELIQWGKEDDTPNCKLFRHVQRWQRRATVPTPFVVEGQSVNVAMRIGNRCLEWVNKHSELLSAGLAVTTE